MSVFESVTPAGVTFDSENFFFCFLFFRNLFCMPPYLWAESTMDKNIGFFFFSKKESITFMLVSVKCLLSKYTVSLSPSIFVVIPTTYPSCKEMVLIIFVSVPRPTVTCLLSQTSSTSISTSSHCCCLISSSLNCVALMLSFNSFNFNTNGFKPGHSCSIFPFRLTCTDSGTIFDFPLCDIFFRCCLRCFLICLTNLSLSFFIFSSC